MGGVRISLIGIFLSICLGSCSKSVTMNRMASADITVPNHIQRLLLADRTAPSNEGVAIIQGILTGEAPFEVRNAAEATLTTVQQELNQSPRYEVIRSRERLRGGLFSQTFPSPLTWAQIDDLCSEYQTDAVLVLEKFTSDFVVTDKRQLVKVTQGTGRDAKQVEVMGVYMEGIASISAGFRFYDPVSRNIFDQINFDKTNVWSAEAENRTQAAALLIDKVKATQFVGRMAGASYARRIAPMPIRITRTMYDRPKSNAALGRGSRLAQVGRWEDALEAWRLGLNQAHNTKAGGRLSYNMAVAYEVLGDLEEAQYWAGRAFTDYGFKQGRNYTRDLRRRIIEEERIQNQLGRN
ncbi:MAG: DUF6340 family protein [Cecembia sp.]